LPENVFFTCTKFVGVPRKIPDVNATHKVKIIKGDDDNDDGALYKFFGYIFTRIEIPNLLLNLVNFLCNIIYPFFACVFEYMCLCAETGTKLTIRINLYDALVHDQ